MIHLAFAGIVGLIYAIWWGNMSSMNDAATIPGSYSCVDNFYDVLPAIYYPTSYGDSLKEATSLMNDI